MKHEGLAASKAKLAEWLDWNKFEILNRDGKHWTLMQGDQLFRISVTAHKDGRQADYCICRESWMPIR